MGTPFSHMEVRPVQPHLAPAWPIERVRAVAKAYREARGLGMEPPQAEEMAVAAHMLEGGTFEQARAEVPKMIRSIGHWHTAWLRRLRLDREVREEEALRRLGWWPPPDDIKGRAVWAAEAVKRAFTPPPDRAEIEKRYWDIQRRFQAMIVEARRRAEAGAYAPQPAQETGD